MTMDSTMPSRPGAAPERPKVTVMVFTYNHAKYIGRCLDSILSQDVPFSLRIHVVDDCSSDGAQDIIRGYAARHPDVVKPFINRRNGGKAAIQKNFHRGFSTLDGDYIAILEGDDYWSVPNKLRDQIAFLDAHPDYVASAHNVLKVYEDNSQRPHIFLAPPNKPTHDIHDLILLQSFFHISTLVFRNVFRGRAPSFFASPLCCDIFVTVTHAQYGKVHFTPDVWSVYQAHGANTFAGMSETQGWLWNTDSLRAFNRWLGYRYARTFTLAVWRMCDYLLEKGKAADGLTPPVRRRYARYRRLYHARWSALRALDLRINRIRPGRRIAEPPVRLNLDCGTRRLHGWTNVDVNPAVRADLTFNLNRPRWPWRTDSVTEAQMTCSPQVLGTATAAFARRMRELHRVCAPGAAVQIRMPFDSPQAAAAAMASDPFPAALTALDRRRGGAPPQSIDFELVQRGIIIRDDDRRRMARGELTAATLQALIKSEPGRALGFTYDLRAHKTGQAGTAPPPVQNTSVGAAIAAR